MAKLEHELTLCGGHSVVRTRVYQEGIGPAL